MGDDVLKSFSARIPVELIHAIEIRRRQIYDETLTRVTVQQIVIEALRAYLQQPNNETN